MHRGDGAAERLPKRGRFHELLLGVGNVEEGSDDGGLLLLESDGHLTPVPLSLLRWDDVSGVARRPE